jgi:hypothetical protein
MTEIDVLDRMIAQAQSKIEELRAALQLEERYLGELCIKRQALVRGGRPGCASHTGMNGTALPQRTARLYADSIPTRLVAILEDAGHEMELADIARELERRGQTTTSKKGMTTVVYNSIRSRRDLFVRVGQGSYDLKARHAQSQVGANGR